MNDQPRRRRRAVLAGLTTAAVVVPQSMAYASLAGLPVQVGLYTAFVPMLVYAALGTSRPLSVSTTSTIAALTGAPVIGAQPASAADAIVVASTLALLCGAVLLLAGLLRLGFLADFISLPVLTGYKAGVGLVIIADQLGKLLGVTVEGEHVGAQVWSALSQLGDAQGTTIVMSIACIAALVVLKRYAPPAVPGPLIVVAVAIAVTALADLAVDGLAIVGAVPGGLPRPQAPDLALLEQLLPSAAGIALMAFVESNAAGRAFTPPGEHEPDADRELLALGAANVGASAFQAMPSGGGLSQTAVNYGAGAQSKLAGLVTALTVMVVLLFLTDLFEELPEATLGALLVVSAFGLVDVRTIGRLRATRTIEGALAVVTVVGVATLGVLDGVLIGVLASILSVMYATNHPPIVGVVREPRTGAWVDSREPPQPGRDGVLVVRIVAALFFANAPRVHAHLLEIAATNRPRVLVIDLSATPDIDVTALAVMEGLAADLEQLGVALRVSSPHDGTRALIASVSADPAWRDRTFPTIAAAVEA